MWGERERNLLFNVESFKGTYVQNTQKTKYHYVLTDVPVAVETVIVYQDIFTLHVIQS